MTCKEAQGMVIPFVRKQLTDEEAEAFLDHVDSCRDCREELEIYYIVEEGIRQLDSDGENYNIKEGLEREMRSCRQRLIRFHGFETARYAADTLIFLCVAVMLLLQIRIWVQYGIF